jgi:hypothetical protein
LIKVAAEALVWLSIKQKQAGSVKMEAQWNIETLGERIEQTIGSGQSSLRYSIAIQVSVRHISHVAASVTALSTSPTKRTKETLGRPYFY